MLCLVYLSYTVKNPLGGPIFLYAVCFLNLICIAELLLLNYKQNHGRFYLTTLMDAIIILLLAVGTEPPVSHQHKGTLSP